MAKKENTQGQVQAQENNGTDNSNLMTMLTVISGFKNDISTLSAQQTAFVNEQPEDVRPIATQLCVNGNRREYSEVDFMFSIYCYHVARYQKNQCSVQSTLKTLPDCFGIDGTEADVENVRKSFKAFDKFFTSPENMELFRKFGVTKLRILSMVHDANVEKVITAITNGKLRPDITVSNLRDMVKEFNGTKNRVNLDFNEKKTASGSKTGEKPAEQPADEKPAEQHTEQPTEKPAEQPTDEKSITVVTDICDNSDKYNNALELAVKYIRYMTDFATIDNIIDDIKAKMQ